MACAAHELKIISVQEFDTKKNCCNMSMQTERNGCNVSMSKTAVYVFIKNGLQCVPVIRKTWLVETVNRNCEHVNRRKRLQWHV